MLMKRKTEDPGSPATLRARIIALCLLGALGSAMPVLAEIKLSALVLASGGGASANASFQVTFAVGQSVASGGAVVDGPSTHTGLLNAFDSTDTDHDGASNEFDSDDDGDRIPDSFENSHGLDPLNPADAAHDRDGDGFNSWQEFAAGTDLDDPGSGLIVTSVNLVEGVLHFEWKSTPGKTYNILFATELPAVSWSNLASSIPAASAPAATTTHQSPLPPPPPGDPPYTAMFFSVELAP